MSKQGTKPTAIVIRAIGFAMSRHLGQLYDDGRPFIEHPLQVYDILTEVTNDPNLLAAALLHDTIEDTPTTYKELVQTFNTDIADLVMEVTKEGAKKTGYYFPRLHSKRGIQLKFADRLANISNMEPWDAKRQAHYLKKSKFWKSEV